MNFYSILVKFPSNTRSLPLPGPPNLFDASDGGQGDQPAKWGHGVLELTTITELADPSGGALKEKGGFCWGDPTVKGVDGEVSRGGVF